MLKPAVAFVFALLASTSLFAADSPPSEASILKLLEVTNSRSLLEGSMGNVDGVMRNAIKQSLQGKQISDEAQKVLDDMSTKVMQLMKDEMNWDSLQPAFMEIYKRSFTQKEVDGMLDFYATDAGKAVIAKMPIVLQGSMDLVQVRMTNLMPKIQKVQQESIAELKALEKK